MVKSFVRIIKFSWFADFFYFSVFKSQLHKNWWSDTPKNSFLNRLIPLDSISNLKFHFENSTSKHIFDIVHHPKIWNQLDLNDAFDIVIIDIMIIEELFLDLCVVWTVTETSGILSLILSS